MKKDIKFLDSGDGKLFAWRGTFRVLLALGAMRCQLESHNSALVVGEHLSMVPEQTCLVVFAVQMQIPHIVC